MKGDKIHSQHVLRYRSELLAREEQKLERQIKLKERVLYTYNTLLHEVGAPPLSPHHTLLDLGAGSRAFVEVCRRAGIKAEGLDIDDGLDFETDSWPVKSSSTDFVNAASLLEHLRDPSVFLSEVHRVLKPGGYFFVVTPHWPYAWKSFYDSYTHYHPYSYVSLAAILKAYYLEPVALVPWVVMKSRLFWRLPPPWSFRLAWLLPFRGDAPAWIPKFLKGRSEALLALARKT